MLTIYKIKNHLTVNPPKNAEDLFLKIDAFSPAVSLESDNPPFDLFVFEDKSCIILKPNKENPRLDVLFLETPQILEIYLEQLPTGKSTLLEYEESSDVPFTDYQPTEGSSE